MRVGHMSSPSSPDEVAALTADTPDGSTRYSWGPLSSYTANSVLVPNGL